MSYRIEWAKWTGSCRLLLRGEQFSRAYAWLRARSRRSKTFPLRLFGQSRTELNALQSTALTVVLWPRFLTKQDFKRIVRPSRPVGAAEMCLISTTCISVARSAQSERHHDSDRERGAGVRIGTTNKCNVRTDYVELRKRVREPAASMPVVVPQETVVLI